jgi:hypothetical protein
MLPSQLADADLAVFVISHIPLKNRDATHSKQTVRQLLEQKFSGNSEFLHRKLPVHFPGFHLPARATLCPLPAQGVFPQEGHKV